MGKPAKQPDEPAKKPGTVTVKVAVAALNEADAIHLRGETFTTTAVRAAALGRLVEPVTAD